MDDQDRGPATTGGSGGGHGDRPDGVAPVRGGHTGPPPFTWKIWSLIWLVYFLYGIGDALGGQRAARFVPAEIALVAAFGLGFVYVMFRAPWQRPLPWRGPALVLLCALGATLMIWQGGDWVGLLTYVSLATAVVLPLPWALRAIPALAVVAGVAAWLTGHGPSQVFLLAFQTAVAGLAVVAFAYGQRMNRALRAAQADLARMAVAEERLRFARDLHDLLGHSLSLIVLKSQLIGRLAETDPARAATEARDVERAARKALTEVREAVTGYRRVTLAAELIGARAALDAANVGHDVSAAPAALPVAVEQVLGWTVREGVTNVLRHSGAGRCEIRFERSERFAAVEIVDDGRGPGASEGGSGLAGSSEGGSGLAGLAERVAGRGGRLVAGAGPTGGFRLRVELPLAPVVGSDQGRPGGHAGDRVAAALGGEAGA